MARRNTVLITLKAVDEASRVVRKVRKEVDTLSQHTGNLGRSSVKNSRKIRDSYKDLENTFDVVGKKQRRLHSIIGGEYANFDNQMRNVGRTSRKALNYLNDIPVSMNRGSGSIRSLSKDTKELGSNLKQAGDRGYHFHRGLSLFLGLDILSNVKDWTIGLAQTREKLKALTRSTMHQKDATEDFFNMMDQMTYDSVVQLDDLAGAMESIRTTANFSDEQIIRATPTIMRLGEIDLLKGHDRNHAFRMMESYAKGLTGKNSMLNTQMDITAGVLSKHGYKKGDIDSYNDAMEKITDRYEDLNEVMDTSYGLQMRAAKYWRLAGRDIGDFFLPALKGFYSLIVKIGKHHRSVLSFAVAFAGIGGTLMTISPSLYYVKSILGDVFGMFSKRLPGGSYGEFIANGGLNLGKKAKGKFAGIKKGFADFGAMYSAGWLNSKDLRKVGKTKAKKGLGKAASKMSGAIAAPFAMLGDVLGVSAGSAAALLAILAAIAVTVYEVGKNFGWWKDLPTMFEAITAGAKRLWEAFKQSETARALHDLFAKIAELIAKIFNVPPGETWDAVNDLINLFGSLDSALADVIDKITWILGKLPDPRINKLIQANVYNETGSPYKSMQTVNEHNRYKSVGGEWLQKHGISFGKMYQIGSGPVGISEPTVKPVSRVTSIYIDKVELDARNWDTQQCKRIFTNALLDLDPDRDTFKKNK